MKKPFTRQIIQATLYYAIGCFVTWLVYVLSGTPYPHGLNAYHLIGLLVIAGGIVWTLKAVGSTLMGKNELGHFVGSFNSSW